MAHRGDTARESTPSLRALYVPTSTPALGVLGATLFLGSSAVAIVAGLWPAVLLMLASVSAALAAIVQAFRRRGGIAPRVLGVLLALAVLLSAGFAGLLLYVLRETP